MQLINRLGGSIEVFTRYKRRTGRRTNKVHLNAAVRSHRHRPPLAGNKHCQTEKCTCRRLGDFRQGTQDRARDSIRRNRARLTSLSTTDHVELVMDQSHASRAVLAETATASSFPCHQPVTPEIGRPQPTTFRATDPDADIDAEARSVRKTDGYIRRFTFPPRSAMIGGNAQVPLPLTPTIAILRIRIRQYSDPLGPRSEPH